MPLLLQPAGAGARRQRDLPTEAWLDVLAQAADLGVLQLHLSGGEPTVRRDLEEIVAQAAKVGLYSNLITAGVLLTRERLEGLAARGLDHVQISIQDAEAGNADRIAHYAGGHAKKLEVAGWVRALGLPLTLNAPIHRQNIDSLPAIIDLAVKPRRAAARGCSRAVLRLGAEEPAGPDADARAGAAKRRPSGGRARAPQGCPRHRFRRARLLRHATKAVHGRLGPRHHQHHAVRQGVALPCGRNHPRARLRQRARAPAARHLAPFGRRSSISAAPHWMREPCRSCELREVDWGGCRCQALAFAGDAAAHRSRLRQVLPAPGLHGGCGARSAEPAPAFVYRNPRAGAKL